LGCERLTDVEQSDDGIPPAIPFDLNVFFESDGEVLIEWQHVNEGDLKGYNIYRKTNKTQYVKVAFTTDDYFFDDSLDYNEVYYYQVTSIDIWNRESMPTREVFVKLINKHPPRKPLSVSINGRNWEGDISVYLSWYSNEESDVAGYNIYRSTVGSFSADSISLIAFSANPSFSDTAALSFYTNYYYMIRAVDKGDLISDESSEVYDQIFELPGLIFPMNNLQTNYFQNFIIKGIGIPATYKIVVQTNIFFDIFWEKDFSSSVINDTISIGFDPPYIEPNTNYYWRVATYSGNSSEPNSVSELYKFSVKP